MHFIIHPGKSIGSKSPVSKVNWYNEHFIRAILQEKSSNSIHYYKTPGMTPGSYILSCSTNKHSVAVTLDPKDKNSIQIDYYHSELNTNDYKVEKTLVKSIIVNHHDLQTLKDLVVSVVEYLVDKASIIEKRFGIFMSPIDSVFCYTIKTLDKIKEGSKQLFVIDTTTPNMPEVIIDKEALVGKPNIYDIVIVKSKTHTCMNRVDFYKFFQVL